MTELNETLTETKSEDRGFSPIHAAAVSEARIEEFGNLLINKAGLRENRWQYEIREAMSSSDFPILLGSIIDRQLLGMYKENLPDWRNYLGVGTVSDFRTNDIVKTWGVDNHLEEIVEYGPYDSRPMAEGKYTTKVKKYGSRFDISWEAIINDRHGAFVDIAKRMNRAALRTEARLATGILAIAAGPNTALFGAHVHDAADNAEVTNLGSLPLTAANLQATLALMAQQKDVNDEPILVTGTHLIVPPALEYTALQILNSALLIGTPASNLLVGATNVLMQKSIKLHVDPYLPIIDESAKKNTTWYVLADPADGECGRVSFLRGYETPQVTMKISGMSSGGPNEGDFDNDRIAYRVRHIVGAACLDPRFCYAQTGS